MPVHKSVDEWIKKDAIPFSVASPASIDSAVDRIVGVLGDAVELLGFGEALHGSEEILVIRNRLFHRLVAAHGYSAVAIEVTSPQARAINEYVAGLRVATDPAVQEWLSAGFGALDANRELIEWLWEYNQQPGNSPKLHFYGFDIPLGQGSLAAPSRVLDISSTTSAAPIARRPTHIASASLLCSERRVTGRGPEPGTTLPSRSGCPRRRPISGWRRST